MAWSAANHTSKFTCPCAKLCEVGVPVTVACALEESVIECPSIEETCCDCPDQVSSPLVGWSETPPVYAWYAVGRSCHVLPAPLPPKAAVQRLVSCRKRM